VFKLSTTQATRFAQVPGFSHSDLNDYKLHRETEGCPALPNGVALKLIAEIDAHNFNTSSMDNRGLKALWKFISINNQFF
jgi:hypothetical protein